MEEKTNAIRSLAQKKLRFVIHDYRASGAVSGLEVARALGQDPDCAFKTLVTVGRSGAHYVFLVPVSGELDLKKAAAAAREKSVEMIPQKELLPLTGYVHGGCSPIGMKKLFPTFVDSSAASFPAILFSGGRIGLQIEMSAEELSRAIPFRLADLKKELNSQ
mgnify:FL=1